MRDIARGIGNHHLDLDVGGGFTSLIDGSLPHADAGDLTHFGAQTPELERVEKAVNGGYIRWTTREIAQRHLQVHVGEQTIETTIARHVVHVFTQCGAALSTDLIGTRQQVVETVKLVDPLRGGLRSHTWHARQVIRRLPHDCSDLRVTMRRYAVLVFDCLRSHTAQITRPRAGIEHGHVVGHRLERVTIAGHHQNSRSLVTCAIRESRKDIVGLKTLTGQRHDTHRIKHLADELHLSLKFFGRRVARALVLRVLLSTE